MSNKLDFHKELKMYIYAISEGEYEYQRDRLLSHQRCYSKDDFKNIVIGAINYNKKHKQDEDNDISLIKETLIDIYGFKKYKVPIQASVYDDWRLENLTGRQT